MRPDSFLAFLLVPLRLWPQTMLIPVSAADGPRVAANSGARPGGHPAPARRIDRRSAAH